MKNWHRVQLGRTACLFALAIIQLGTFDTANAEDKMTPEQAFEPRQFSQEIDGKVATLNYRLLKPKDYDPTEKYPLVIFLHGAGERGDDNTAQLKHGTADFLRPKIRDTYPCYVLAPQCPKNEKWADVDWTQPDVKFPAKQSQSLTLTLELVATMLEKSAIDSKRVYITGLSMGGYGTWDAIARHPDMFAAALPICGGADPSTAKEVSRTPVWCFHGAKDRVVPVEFSRKMIKSLKDADSEPRYTEYPEAGHDSWTETYRNDEIYEWMFSQRRTAKPAGSPAK